MFERFTASARRVVVLAQDEARALDHDHIGTEHLLLALVLADEGIAAGSLCCWEPAAQRYARKSKERSGTASMRLPDASR